MATATTPKQRPPFRAEHLGSLLRPQALVDRRVQLDGEKAVVIAADAELKRLEDAAINDIVQLQLDLGYHAVTDGEFRRHQFWGTFFPALEGMEEVADPPLDMFRLYVPDLAAFTEAGHKPGESVVCVGKIRHAGSTYVDQWAYLKSRLPADRVAEAKITLPAPEWYHLRYKPGRAYPPDVYADDQAYFADIAAAYRTELRILYDAGCRNVTIDDPNLAYFCSEKMLQGFRDHGEDAEALLDSYVQLYNDCLADRPADLHVGLHLCRGNFAYSRHFSEGGYDRVAAKLFRGIRHVDTYFLEYDTPRAGGFAPLRELPPNKNVVVGVVTSKFPQLEDLDHLRARVLEAADHVAAGTPGQTRQQALQRLAVSPQCGFASHHLGNSLSRQDMVNKLKLVRQLADSLWPGEP